MALLVRWARVWWGTDGAGYRHINAQHDINWHAADVDLKQYAFEDLSRLGSGDAVP